MELERQQTTEKTTEKMRNEIRRYSDARLRKELLFAEGFSGDGDDLPEAVTWLYLLRVEAKARAQGGT